MRRADEPHSRRLTTRRRSTGRLRATSSAGSESLFAARYSRGVRDGHRGQDQDEDDDGVNLGKLLAAQDGAEDPQRQRVLRPGGEGRNDDFVEAERERE